MASGTAHPALTALIHAIAPELVFGEVLISNGGDGYELRHRADRGAAGLREVLVADLRSLAATTEAGVFRPLKAAPNLRRGWRSVARNAQELEDALRHLYPGAVAAWFAGRLTPPPVTDYRAFTARQSGMYRVTATLSDVQVAAVARAGCHKRFCLKQRLWTVDGLERDRAEEKSLLKCLEPCAVLLEFARVIAWALERGEAPPADEGVPTREADFSQGGNPRLAQWRLEIAALARS